MIGILRIKDQEGQWQDIQAIKGAPGEPGKPFTYEDFTPEQLAALKGEPGKDGTMRFEDLTPEQIESLKGQDGAPGKDGRDGQDYVLTEADKEEIAALIDISGIDVDLTNYSTTEEMNEAIAASRYNVGQGLFYDQNRNMIGINMNNSGRLVLNNGVLDVNQSNLFNNSSNKVIFTEEVEFSVAEGVNTIYEFEPDVPLEEFHQFMNQMLQSPMPLNLTIRMGEQMGIGNTVVPEVLVQQEMPNGKFYNVVFNFTNMIGPNIQSATGFQEIYIGAINQKYDLIIVSNGQSIPPITMVSMSQNSTNPSLAHFWIGNGQQFRRYGANGLNYIELNEDYINMLIDNKFDGIAKAEAGVY